MGNRDLVLKENEILKARDLHLKNSLLSFTQIPPFHRACSEKSFISISWPAVLLLQAITYRSFLCLIYPYRSWLRRPFGPFFTSKGTEGSCLNTEKRDKFILFTEIEKFYSPAQRRQGEMHHRRGWNQENDHCCSAVEYPDGCKSCQAQET